MDTLAGTHTEAAMNRSKKDALEWFSIQVARGKLAFSKNDLHFVTAFLDPPLAEILLERNPMNRYLQSRNLAGLKSELTEGRMTLNGESIIISPDGELNDGQHRCHAVFDTKLSYKTAMVFGASRDSRNTTDGGVPRTPKQLGAMNNVQHPSTMGAASKLLLEYRKKNRVCDNSNSPVTRTNIIGECIRNEKLGESVRFVESTIKLIGNKSLLSFCHYIFAEVSSKEDADFFMMRLDKGTNLKDGSSILYCRNALTTHKKRYPGNRAKAELIFKCWNAHRIGNDILRLSITGDELPELHG